jgi:hypothetical protein
MFHWNQRISVGIAEHDAQNEQIHCFFAVSSTRLFLIERFVENGMDQINHSNRLRSRFTIFQRQLVLMATEPNRRSFVLLDESVGAETDPFF